MERGEFLKNNGGDGSQVTMALSAVVSDHNSAIVDGIDGKFRNPFPRLFPLFFKRRKILSMPSNDYFSSIPLI